MCRVRQIKLGLVDKGPFTHRCMVGELELQSARESAQKASQSTNQPASKLISQPAIQRSEDFGFTALNERDFDSFLAIRPLSYFIVVLFGTPLEHLLGR